MVLATPFFRHLARPREAEMTEREKVRRNLRCFGLESVAVY